MLDKDAPTALSDDEIMPLSRGDLAPKTVYVDKAISLTEGEVITVYGRWSPAFFFNYLIALIRRFPVSYAIT